MNILVLEDDLPQQEILKIHGESLGHKVTCAADMEGFKTQLQEAFDLIIMDNFLGDGVDAFNEIGWVREKVGPCVGIVGLTAVDSFKDIKDNYQEIELLNHLFCKPLSMANLESALFFVGGNSP
jgi:DNA-binding response OmpR family regulator